MGRSKRTMSQRRTAVWSPVGVLCAALLLASSPGPARACSCALMPAAQARDAAAVVFEGVLERVLPAADGAPERGVFRVERVWKGAIEATLVVQLNTMTFCPPHFTVGERYVVYADGTEASPRVRSCQRWAAGAQLEAERRELGAPIRTFPLPRTRPAP